MKRYAVVIEKAAAHDDPDLARPVREALKKIENR